MSARTWNGSPDTSSATPFRPKKMWATEPGPISASGSILYRSDMNKKIGRNFEVFTPCDFTALITQHIRDKSFQRVRYYEWYSNKMHGRRAKQADEEVQTEGDAVEVSDVSAHEPRRIPSKKWRELIKKGGRPAAVPEVLTGGCYVTFCAIWALARGAARAIPAPTRRAKRPSIRGSTTDYDTGPVGGVLRHLKLPARVRISHPLFSGPQPSGGRAAGAPRNPKKPVFDFRAHFCHSAPMETHAFGFTLRANAPEGQKRFPISDR